MNTLKQTRAPAKQRKRAATKAAAKLAGASKGPAGRRSARPEALGAQINGQRHRRGGRYMSTRDAPQTGFKNDTGGSVKPCRDARLLPGANCRAAVHRHRRGWAGIKSAGPSARLLARDARRCCTRAILSSRRAPVTRCQAVNLLTSAQTRWPTATFSKKPCFVFTTPCAKLCGE